MANYSANIEGTLSIRKSERANFETLFAPIVGEQLRLCVCTETARTIEFNFSGNVDEGDGTLFDWQDTVVESLPKFATRKCAVTQADLHGMNPDGMVIYTITPNKKLKWKRF